MGECVSPKDESQRQPKSREFIPPTPQRMLLGRIIMSAKSPAFSWRLILPYPSTPAARALEQHYHDDAPRRNKVLPQRL